jgi:hypothetical protein
MDLQAACMQGWSDVVDSQAERAARPSIDIGRASSCKSLTLQNTP